MAEYNPKGTAGQPKWNDNGPNMLFGLRTNNKMHVGQDFGTKDQPYPIPSASNGNVYYNGQLNGYGHVVIVKHEGRDGSTFYSLYAHLRDPSPLERFPV